MKVNTNVYKNEKSHMENVVLNLTDNRLLGIMFIISMIGFVFVRRNFGVRVLKLEITMMTVTGLVVIEGLASWFSALPLIGRKSDFSSFLILAVLYFVMSAYHMVRAYMNARTIPFQYTRHMGDGYVYDWVSKLNLPFFRQSPLRINAFAEPVFMILIGTVISKWFAESLGNFLIVVAICMCTVGVFIIKNHDRMKYDQNDAIFLGEMTQDNMKDVKPTTKKQSATRSHAVHQSVKKNNRT